MKIAVSVENNQGLESTVAHHFGRSPYFALVQVEKDQIQSVSVIENPFFETHQPGQVPGFIKDQNAEVMLSGGIGRRVLEFFNQFGIEIATGASGSVGDATTAYIAGELRGASSCAGSKEHGDGHGYGHTHNCD